MLIMCLINSRLEDASWLVHLMVWSQPTEEFVWRMLNFAIVDRKDGLITLIQGNKNMAQKSRGCIDCRERRAIMRYNKCTEIWLVFF